MNLTAVFALSAVANNVSRSAGRAIQMEAVIFIGVPASGKSSFFKERLFASHVRISLDLLKTRHREQRILEVCLTTGQRFVVDNTNPTRQARSPYIAAAKAAGFTVTSYYFRSSIQDCLQRNAARLGNERVPDVAILSCAKQLQRPTIDEGYDQLYYVRLTEGTYSVEAWRDDV